MKRINFIAIIFFMIYSMQCYPFSTNSGNLKKEDDKYYMQKATQLAKHNPKAPFAALIVDNETGKIIAEGLNASKINPTYHGEMVVIN